MFFCIFRNRDRCPMEIDSLFHKELLYLQTMSQYIVSARKYRPDSFETLLGQDNIARTLSNSIKRGQLAHAYLFCGPRGVGKTTTATVFSGRMMLVSGPLMLL